MEKLLRFMIIFLTTATALVIADGSTSHYLGCLHESQCQKVLGGAYCCPAGTCCHFFVRDSSKFMSHCKRIRATLDIFCQQRDKIILSDEDLHDKRFLNEYPPNKGAVCVRRRTQPSIFCFGGTDSEEREFKAQEIEMTEIDALETLDGVTYKVVRSDIKDMNTTTYFSYVKFVLRKLWGMPWEDEE